MQQEKRKFRRINSDFSVRISPANLPASISVGKSKNVSAIGILFQSDKALEIGSIINLKFLKPNSFDFFEGTAKVVRLEMGDEDNMYEIGVQFIDMSESEQEKLNYFFLRE